MCTNLKKLSISSLALLILSIISCHKKGNDPSGNGLAVITNTNVVTNTHTQATISYEITGDGGNTITENGICYGVNPSPTTADSKMAAPSNQTGKDTIQISGLNTSTKYYARAYAINSKGTTYGNEVNFTTKTIDIGDSYAGGIVFYVDASGLHGLVSAGQGLGMNAKWGCPGTSIPATGTAIGTGKANTTAIVKACSDPDIAARMCVNLTHNGFKDWYLPSKDELAEMYKYRAQIGFNTTVRWSSSEADANNAWASGFDVGSTPAQTDKNTVHGVRPIRSF